MLQVDRVIHLSLGRYKACICPAAGARLTRLLWHDGDTPLECVTPWPATEHFDPFQWPKAGAFPMLPFTNRLRNARLNWGSKDLRITPQQGQPHALHGIGHRRPWKVVKTSAHALTLSLDHELPDADWPWSFAAEMRYVLSLAGLQVCISVRNTSFVEVPVALGWHPFMPLAAPVDAPPRAVKLLAVQSHDMSPDGLSRAALSMKNGETRQFELNTRTPQTTVYEGWDGQLLISADSTHSLCLSSPNASHLVLHVPVGRSYLCAEPVTALPGAVANYSAPQKQLHLALAPGATRRITCCLGVVANPT